MFSCLDHVAHVSWSPDSSHLLCVLQQRAVVQVFSLADPQWAARIDEGPAGAPTLPAPASAGFSSALDSIAGPNCALDSCAGISCAPDTNAGFSSDLSS